MDADCSRLILSPKQRRRRHDVVDGHQFSVLKICMCVLLGIRLVVSWSPFVRFFCLRHTKNANVLYMYTQTSLTWCNSFTVKTFKRFSKVSAHSDRPMPCTMRVFQPLSFSLHNLISSLFYMFGDRMRCVVCVCQYAHGLSQSTYIF